MRDGPPPAVDDGRLASGWATLGQELAPAPGRLDNTVRLVVLVLATVAISETFRLPDPAVSAYVVLFVSRSERASTVTTAVVAGLALILGVLVTIVVFMLSLSEPALRVPLIAGATFVAVFLSRVSPLGPAAFAAGFIIAYGLTLGDQLLGLSLQAATVSNTTRPGLPELLFMPPEEALLRFLLWLSVVIAVPVALVVIANLLTGREPLVMLRDALAARLDTAARFCAGAPGAERALGAQMREGAAGLDKLLAQCSGLDSAQARQLAQAGLVGNISRLAPLLLTWARLAPRREQPDLPIIGAACRRMVRSIQAGSADAGPAPLLDALTSTASGPIAAELSRCVAAIHDALRPERAAPTAPARTDKPARNILAADAWSNPGYVHFALKVTLAVMLCYAGESLAAWPQVHTAVVTCFFVSLGTVGESAHKAILRVAGATIGGALGIATILVLMPFMTDLGDLLLAIAAVTFIAGWIAGSERIGYAGLQIGFAYYLTVLQGYGPTLDMQTARDRVIGILIGNAVVLAVFTTIWPASVAQPVRRGVANAVEQLAALMALEDKPDDQARGSETALRNAFDAATSGALGMLANAGAERAVSLRPGVQRPIDASVVTRVQALMVPVDVILRLRSDPAWRALPEAVREAASSYHRAMADWFGRCARWVATGAGGERLTSELPEPPALPNLPDVPANGLAAAWDTWYHVLHQDLAAIMRDVAPQTDAPAAIPEPVLAVQ